PHLPEHSLVDRDVPGVGHHAHRPGDQYPGRLAARRAGPTPEPYRARLTTRMNSTLQLDTLFTAGALLDDRDGDGLPDALRARIVVGSQAQLPEHLAAVDLAARLGFASL